ncbi:MAG: glycoside hydrolase family 43 protein [Lachnospiraceae bacterium]|nr:glycoside hydrolase family 43 protein [Lachnospiraceae bacterium]
MREKKICAIITAMCILGIIFSGCGSDGIKVDNDTIGVGKVNVGENDVTVNTDVEINVGKIDAGSFSDNKEGIGMEKIEALDFVKNPTWHNPVYTQKYSADPYAMEYDGRIYLYMTGDQPMFTADGIKKTNDYSNINTIRVISSADLVNWTDHGEVYAAGKDGAATWGGNSWAPAACWKMIDGKPKFFLYFANSGNGIAVLSSDSPVGPFVDPIKEALVSRKTPTCAEVTWLFDPAVLVDDDGTGYLYFGGGVPGPDKVSNPGTARVAKLSDDMIHLDGDPIPIKDVLYLFEDSGINKVNGTYTYSYCTNYNVPESGCEGYGFGSGEIITMESDSPMGPFTMVGSVLKNPGFFFKNGGNNHHCIFSFKDNWYITYHASLIEESLDLSTGYRSVNIDKITVGDDGNFKPTRMSKEGVDQLGNFVPEGKVSFVTMSNQSGTEKVAADATTDKCGSGSFNLKVVETGSWIQLSKVDFGEGKDTFKITLKGAVKGSISIRTKFLNSDDAARLVFDGSDEFSEYEVKLAEPVSGVNDLYFVFEGADYELACWEIK